MNLEKFRDLHILRLVFGSWCELAPQTFQEALSWRSYENEIYVL